MSPRAPSPTPVAEGGRRAEGERKTVTVLACDIDFHAVGPGGREGGGELDPELVHTLLDRFLALAREEVEHFEGRVRQMRSRGVMALFGAPAALEDHPYRAVLAALALMRRLDEENEELARRHGAGWEARMGLASGPVVFGGESQLAVGEAPTAASRLRQRAGPGEILAGGRFRRLVEGRFLWQAWEGESSDAEEETFLVRGLLEEAEVRPITLTGGSLSPFVGRLQELALLEQAWGEARAGRGQVVGLAGEAGAGKTRLLREFARRHGTDGARTLRGHCLPYGAGVPYLPWLILLRRGAGVGVRDREAAAGEKLAAWLRELGVDPEPALPYILRLFDMRPGTEALDGLDAQIIQHRTFEHLRQLLLTASRKAPLVLEIEDLHWIDKTSEDLLASLIDPIGAARVLVLATYRSGYRPRFMDRSYATQISVQRLSPEDSRGLVAGILARDEAPDGLNVDTLATDILEKAEGNPFFLEELAWSWLELGEARGRTTLPDTIQGLLMARLDRLPEEHKRLLQTASVLGREFSRTLLAAVWDSPTPIDPLLADLLRWEFLQEASGRDDGDLTTCLFRHALTQEVASGSLLSDRQVALHRAAARALEGLYPEQLEQVCHRLARHHAAAGNAEKTVHYLGLAAEKAARAYAHVEAAQALRQALEHAEHLPAGDGGAERDRTVVRLLLRLASSLLPLTAFQETLECLLAQERRVEALADPALSGPFHFWLAHTYSYLGHPEEAHAHARRGLAAAEEAGDEATRGRAHYILGREAFWAGRFVEGLEDSLRAIVLLERSGEPWWQGQAYWVAAYHHHALGRFGEAFEALSRAATIGEALADPRLDTSWSAGYFHASLGDWESGIAESQAGVERARDPLNTAASLGFLGCGYLEKGDLELAITTLEDAIGRLREAGMRQLEAWFTAYLGEALLRCGRLKEARQRAEGGLVLAREADFRYGEGLALRTLGRVALREEKAEEAATHFEAALTLFEHLQMPLEQAWSHLDLGHLDKAAGGATPGAHLEQARKLFTDLDLPGHVERVGGRGRG